MKAFLRGVALLSIGIAVGMLLFAAYLLLHSPDDDSPYPDEDCVHVDAHGHCYWEILLLVPRGTPQKADMGSAAHPQEWDL